MKDLGVRVEKDIRYSDAGRRGLLDVYLPGRGRGPQRAGAAAGARRRLDDRQQGPAGHPADAAHGRQGLGLRGDQLPARSARPVPGARHRREAGDRLDPRAHRGVRRQPRLHRHHRRLGRRPPRRAGRADRRRPGVPARLRGRRHLGPGGDPPLRRLRLRRLDRPAQRRAAARRVPGAADPAEDLGRLARRLRGRLARSCGSPRTRPTSSCSTASTTRWSRSTRPGCSSSSLRAHLEAHRRVRRAARRPARVRRLPVDPVRPRRPRDRPLPALALEQLARRRPRPAAGPLGPIGER